MCLVNGKSKIYNILDKEFLSDKSNFYLLRPDRNGKDLVTMNDKTDVSVCVAIYNSDFSKLLITLSSIIIQKGIIIEIIIADDGSKKDLSPQIRDFFVKKHFSRYKIIRNNENKGTVSNFFEAVKAADGEYIKCIAPGDLLYSENALAESIEYMKRSNLDACFSNAAYYSDKHELVFPKVLIAPQEVSCYIKNQITLQKLYCLILSDFICGATFMVTRDVFFYYLNMIVDRVKYSEDSIYRIMIFDEKRIGFYDALTIYYHYGEGISTSKKTKWIKLLYNDNNALNMILLQKCKGKSFFEKRFKMVLKYCGSTISLRNRVLRSLIFPESFFLWCKSKFNRRLNTKDASFDFYKKCKLISNEYEEQI